MLNHAKIQRFLSDKKAVTALEYGILASLIAIAIIAAVGVLGSSVSATFTFIASEL